MAFYSARFGAPPLTHLEVSPVPGRFGQGFPGMIYLSTLSYLPVTARPIAALPAWQQLFYGELLRAHEAAHQWLGNIVVSGSYHNEWIMEALSNYSALMFLESRKGPGFIDSVLTEYRTQMLTKDAEGATFESAGPLVDGQRLNTSDHPGAWEAIAYGKGVWVFHMLRKRMGDAAFNKMLGELRRRYEYKLLDTESLRSLCAEFLPAGAPDPKLENFFDEWVYGTGVPTLKLTYSVKGKPGAYRLTGSVEQSGVSDDFSVTIPVEIQTGKGKVVQQVRTGSDPATFSVAVIVPTAKAVLDPGQTILKR
jgi:aminopeptidase N